MIQKNSFFKDRIHLYLCQEMIQWQYNFSSPKWIFDGTNQVDADVPPSNKTVGRVLKKWDNNQYSFQSFFAISGQKFFTIVHGYFHM